MVPVPSPPTDNLYKFLAVSGVLLVVLGVVGPLFSSRSEIDIRIQRADRLEERFNSMILEIARIAQNDKIESKEERQKQIARISSDVTKAAENYAHILRNPNTT